MSTRESVPSVSLTTHTYFAVAAMELGLRPTGMLSTTFDVLASMRTIVFGAELTTTADVPSSKRTRQPRPPR